MSKYKLFILVCIGILLVGNSNANTPVYGSATSFDQLTYRVLDRGQIAWMEDDGSAVMYVGSMTEDRNIKFTDPAALRGCRVVEISSELVKACSSNMVSQSEGTFKFQLDSVGLNNPDDYRYTATLSTNVSDDVIYYIKNSDGTYTKASLTPGQYIEKGSYYTRTRIWKCKVMIASKDSNIVNLDFLYQERQGSFGDLTTLNTSRNITYDGRYAYIDIEVSFSYDSVNTKDWFTVGNFTATTIGMGDQLGYVNDLSKIKFYIRDSLCNTNVNKRTGVVDSAFDLFKLREWAKNLYNGNRGKDWSKYKALEDIQVENNFIRMWSSNGTEKVKYSFGTSDGQFGFYSKGLPFLKYKPYIGEPSYPSDAQIQITAWDVPTSGDCIMEFMSNFSITNLVYLTVVHKKELDKGDWQAINVVIEDLDDTHMNFKATVPAVYHDSFKSGFFKVSYDPDKIKNNLKVAATLSILGADGKYYKLVIPVGGGNVTAVVDEDQF